MEFKIYNLRYKENTVDKELKFFGEEFIKNNGNKYKVIYHNKMYDLKEKIEVKKTNNERENKEVKIKLIFHKSIFNNCYMFKDCKSLIQFSFEDEGNNNFKSKLIMI